MLVCVQSIDTIGRKLLTLRDYAQPAADNIGENVRSWHSRGWNVGASNKVRIRGCSFRIIHYFIRVLPMYSVSHSRRPWSPRTFCNPPCLQTMLWNYAREHNYETNMQFCILGQRLTLFKVALEEKRWGDDCSLCNSRCGRSVCDLTIIFGMLKVEILVARLQSFKKRRLQRDASILLFTGDSRFRRRGVQSQVNTLVMSFSWCASTLSAISFFYVKSYIRLQSSQWSWQGFILLFIKHAEQNDRLEDVTGWNWVTSWPAFTYYLV